MKNKLAFHADKMKLVCILEAISQGLCVIWIIFRVMAAEKKMEDYSQLIITSIFFICSIDTVRFYIGIRQERRES